VIKKEQKKNCGELKERSKGGIIESYIKTINVFAKVEVDPTGSAREKSCYAYRF